MPLSSPKSLIYIADPMCSWCWGFSPVMDVIREKYGDNLAIELLVGGLRPGNTERFDEHRRKYILGHWQAVHERTQQSFNFAFHMGPDFTYDTEPASRAVIVMRTLNPTQTFPFFRTIQRAFYVENHDVTQESVLKDLAKLHGLDQEAFSESFHHPPLRQYVWQEFDRCRELGISGFPSLVAMDGDIPRPLAHEYVPAENLIPKIEDWLKV